MPSFQQWIKFRHFRLVIAIAEHGSILAAAESLNMSQPTASKILHDLEGFFRRPLFTRTNKGVEITDLGREFVIHGRALVGQLERAAQTLEAMSAGADGHVTIGTFLTAATLLIPTAVTQLREAHPGITVTIYEASSDRLMPRLLSGELDLVVGRLIDFHNDVEQEALYEDELCIVGRKGHPLAGRRDVSLAELLNEEWVLPPPGAALRAQFEAAFHSAQMNAPGAAIESASASSNRIILSRTDMLAVWSRSVIEEGPDQELLGIINVATPPALGTIGVCRRRGAPATPAIEALLDQLRLTGKRLGPQQ